MTFQIFVDRRSVASYIVSIYGNYVTMKHIDDKQALKKIFEMQCEICKALGHPLRLAIVDRLQRRAKPPRRI